MVGVIKTTSAYRRTIGTGGVESGTILPGFGPK